MRRRDAPPATVGDLMTEDLLAVLPPAAISVEATVREAAESMISSRTHHLLVEDGHEVIGILSTFDLLDALTVTEA